MVTNSRPKARKRSLRRAGRARRRLRVLALAGSATRGQVRIGQLAFPCALGRSGRRVRKVEGDGATPVGVWRLRTVFYRLDRGRRPFTMLPLKVIRPDDGWCDDRRDRNYNRRVRFPYSASAERLWRDDHLYDIVVVISHNEQPRVKGGGSAIFIHLARRDYAPTEGCIALERKHLERLLRLTSARDVLVVG